jgi:rubrerythrin
MQIHNAEELHKLLSKALQIESEYETAAEWEGYVSVTNPRYRDLLFELISDSEKHATWVKDMLGMVVLPSDYRAPPLPPVAFDFRNRSEFDTLLELERYEQLMLDLYVAIKEAMQRSDVQGYIMPGESQRMMELLEQLIIEETGHRDAIHFYVGKIKMIR